MGLPGFTFSSDAGLTLEDVRASSALSERAFKTARDAFQMRVAEEKTRWVFRHRPETVNIIKHRGTVIGFSFLVLTTRKIMKAFLSRKITEEGIFTLSKNVTARTFSAIYLCAAVVRPAFRGKGLAQQGFIKSIRKLMRNKKPVLFYWGYSPAGTKVAERIAAELKLPVLHLP